MLTPRTANSDRNIGAKIKTLVSENKSFAIIALIMLATGAVGLVSINNVSKITSDIFFENVQPSEKIREINDLMVLYRLKVYQQIASIETDEEVDIELKSLRLIIDEKLEAQSSLFLTEQEKGEYEELLRLWRGLKLSYFEILELSFNYAKEEALEAIAGDNLILSELRQKTASRLIELKSQGVEDAYHSSQSIKTWNVWLTLVALIVGIVFCLLIVRQYNRKIENYLQELKEFNRSLEEKVDQRTKAIKESEERARATEVQIRDIIENMTEGLVCYGPDQRLILCNSTYRDFYGYSEEDAAVNTHFEDLIQLDHERETIVEDGSYTEQRIAFRNDPVGSLLIHLSDGRWLMARERSTSMGTVSIQTDITERKRAEEELVIARKAADEANQTKSAFLANMSHELRTPMNAILGYAEMLAEDAEEEGNDDQLADLKEISDAGEHLLSLLNDVLDISKIEAGRMDLYLETFDLTKMMGEVASTTKTLVEKNQNAMEVSISEDLGEMHADVTKVRQILFNLMSNSAKFTSDGTITLFGERRAISGGDIIRLGVSDTGIGIPEDKLDHVFEEFAQADDSTTKDFGGTGLGLALVRRFCQMMGGEIWVESTMGKGSSFILELPATVVEQEEGPAEDLVDESSQPSSEESAVSTPGSILVIDDDRNARELIKRSLESEGHSVVVAESGDKGIALAHSLKPSLITLDIMMPSRDGWSVLQELKDDPDLRDIPVVMVSMIDDNRMGHALGAVDHLSKPVDRSKLKALVKRYSKIGRALVVEDNDSAREIVTRALTSVGWTSVEAENGAVGIEKFSDGDFNLIILDIMMPVMDGFGFIRELRKTEKGRSVPVVVLTAKDLTKKERKELNGNVEEIFLKEETNIKELVLEIEDLLIR